MNAGSGNVAGFPMSSTPAPATPEILAGQEYVPAAPPVNDGLSGTGARGRLGILWTVISSVLTIFSGTLWWNSRDHSTVTTALIEQSNLNNAAIRDSVTKAWEAHGRLSAQIGESTTATKEAAAAMREAAGDIKSRTPELTKAAIAIQRVAERMEKRDQEKPNQ